MLKFIFVILVLAKPLVTTTGTRLNSHCICGNSTNTCNKTLSCRLPSNLTFDNAPIPSWVTSAEISLISSTVNRALAGNLTSYIDPWGESTDRIGWYATEACDGASAEKIWNADGCGSVNNGGWMSGYAMLGYHPWGTEPGTWLTQILAEVLEPDGDPYWGSPVCAGSGLFVNLTKINDTVPYDPRFTYVTDTCNFWNQNSPFYGTRGVASYRTDNDLIANGVDLNCSSLLGCVSGNTFATDVEKHFECLNGGVGYVSPSRNC